MFLLDSTPALQITKSKMEEYAIETWNLSKRFGELVAVDHISFDVKKGRYLAS